MGSKVNLNTILKPSDDVVARDVQGEMVIIPITSGIEDSEDEIFTLNERGRAIWDRLDGKKTLQEVVKDLEAGFVAGRGQIEKDVLGITEELLKKNMVVACLKK